MKEMIERFEFKININDIEAGANKGETILDVARRNDIFIPTFCYDDRVDIYGACGICVCEVEGNPKLVKACATEVADGMTVRTNTERVIESRKTNLELLMTNHKGDCRPPCVLNCPAHTDCQGYVGFLAEGDFKKGIELVTEKIPLPASLGRVCPHPCEENCRRALVDEPIAIRDSKRLLAEEAFFTEDFAFKLPEEFTGKKVSIIGGGPMGLSAACFLRQLGHDITVYEAMPYAGGMLRYGIPEYRLPKKILDAEISKIKEMGIDIKTNTRIGSDISFDEIRKNSDAVLLGIGAWKSTGTGCKGEDSNGVIGGIEFLQKKARGIETGIGKNVAIIGGGNTAMDAARTAVRLGAQNVYNVYRRTTEQMPAEEFEIKSAEEEGVIFKTLRNPIEIFEKDGRVNAMELQVMELGEEDASGRRRPVAVEGKTEMLNVDTVILAIGQAVDSELFGEVEKTKRNAIAYDEKSFMTSMEGVFAGGDCGNDKISIAIEAIADAKKVTEAIDNYLSGKKFVYTSPYYVTRSDITSEDFEDRERKCRANPEVAKADERKDNFNEVEKTIAVDLMKEEAKRCLECGCKDYFECKLIKYSHMYEVEPERLYGDHTDIDFEDDHPFVTRDPNKCILCGLCVRVCDETLGIGALGLVNRGFDTVIMPEMGRKLCESGCVSCGMCISVCPTGALKERCFNTKDIPANMKSNETVCEFCSVGCKIDVQTAGNLVMKADAINGSEAGMGLACGRGKFGLFTRYTEPFDSYIGNKKAKKEAAIKSLVNLIGDASKKKYVSISARYTTEEVAAIKKFADAIGADVVSHDVPECGAGKVFGTTKPLTGFDELNDSDFILCALDVHSNPIISPRLISLSKQGKEIVMITNQEGTTRSVNIRHINTDKKGSAIAEVFAGVVKLAANSDKPFSSELIEYAGKINVSDEAMEVAKRYLSAKNPAILYSDSIVTFDGAVLLSDIAAYKGSNLIHLRKKNNTQGLLDFGIKPASSDESGILISFGVDITDDMKAGFERIAHVDVMYNDRADVFIREPNGVKKGGSFTNAEGRVQAVKNRFIKEGDEGDMYDLLNDILNELGIEETAIDYEDAVKTVEAEVYGKNYAGSKHIAAADEINVQFMVPKSDILLQEQGTSDALHTKISQELGKLIRQR